MVTPTSYVIAWVELHCAGPLALEKFCNIFLPNIGENQKKSYYLSAGPLALCHLVNVALLLHYVQKKVRWEPKVATFRTTTVNFIHSHLILCNIKWLCFIRVMHLNLLSKTKVRVNPWWSILLLITICTRVMFQMPKETEHKKTIDFLSYFCHWWQFNCGEPGPWAFPGYAYVLAAKQTYVVWPRFCSYLCNTWGRLIRLKQKGK